MKSEFRNLNGQVVGEFDSTTQIYTTIRDKRRGEIFIKKNWFGGKFMKTPIAIDKRILGKLLNKGCKTIRMIVMGLKTSSYVVLFDILWVLENSEKINYDIIKQGKNFTNFGSQLVFDLEKGLPEKQSKLNQK